jgi:hypothetical protein
MVSRDVKYKITELVAEASSAQTNYLGPMPGPSLRQRVIPKPPQ